MTWLSHPDDLVVAPSTVCKIAAEARDVPAVPDGQPLKTDVTASSADPAVSSERHSDEPAASSDSNDEPAECPCSSLRLRPECERCSRGRLLRALPPAAWGLSAASAAA